MSQFDVIQLEFPDLRPDVEDWLWLDRNSPRNQARIVETEQVVNSLLRLFGCDPDSMSEAQKAQYLFQKIGKPYGFGCWLES